MKTFLSLLLTLAMTTPVLAQGKIRLVNDSVHLVYWTTKPNRLYAQDWALEGQAYALGQGSETLAIELWGGTSSAALTLQAWTDFHGQGSLGTWSGLNVVLSFPGGAPAFFQIKIYDAADGSYEQAYWWHYTGRSPIFQAIPSTNAAYNSINNHNPFPNAASTWADGTQPVLGSYPGATGAIELGVFGSPEPSVFALSALALSLLLLRRRAEKSGSRNGTAKTL